MRHSRSISDLRADVAENCRTLLTLAEREGLSVLVTETVRDAAYQRMLAEKGYAAKGAVTPSFHGWGRSESESDFPGEETGGAFPTGRIFSGMRAECTRAR